MGSRLSHLLFLACALTLLLSRLPSGVIYAIFFILLVALLAMGNFGEDKAGDVWRKLKKRIPEGSWARDVVITSDLWAKIYSLRQGDQTVEKYIEEFRAVWKELETIRPLPACTCGEKCSCCEYLQKERNKLKVLRFLEGLDGDRFDATRSKIMLKSRLPSLAKVYNLVKEAAQTASAAKQKQDVKQPPKRAKTRPGKVVNEVQELNCPIHQRPLIVKRSGRPHECSGCLDLRLAPSHCCETDNCNYLLHKECAIDDANNSPVGHPFFEKGKFKFYKKKNDNCEKVCTACGNDVRGFFYHCDTTKKYLHPCCLKLKESVSDKAGQVLKLREKVPKKCQICGRKKVKNNIKGWAYVSPDEKNRFHVSCVNGLILHKADMSLQRSDLTTRIPLTCKQMTIARPSRKGSGKTKVFIKMATVALELIVSVILGNPAPLIVGAIGAISS